MKKLTSLIAALLIVALPGVSSAAKNPWMECGIGAMIFTDIPVAAAISNIIWDLGTTAVSSNASSEDTCKGTSVAAARFIQETYANLEEDTAKGDGKHVRAMLNIAGCNAASQPAIISSIRSDFEKVVSNENYADKSRTEKAQDYYHIVNNKISGDFAQACQAI